MKWLKLTKITENIFFIFQNIYKNKESKLSYNNTTNMNDNMHKQWQIRY
jgi:hypothetical protein